MNTFAALFRLSAIGLLTASLALLTPSAGAQDQTKDAGKKAPQKSQAAEPATGKQTSGPFRGKLVAVDKAAKSITVGKRTFFVTADTKIFKAGNPATLNDGVVGEITSGGFKTEADGRRVATKITFGPVPGAKGEEKAAPSAQPEKKKKNAA